MQQLAGNVEQAMSVLKASTIEQIMLNKKRLIEVPYNASVKDTLNAMHAHDILAVAVAAPPGQWIGAGGSQILEADKATGAIRKHYIGLVSVLDVLVHVVEDNAQLNAPVSSIIGHSLEGLNLWTITPNTSVYDAIEPMSKGVHRVLVPFETESDVQGVELTESSSGYHILTQMDIIKFIHERAELMNDILRLSVSDIGAVRYSVFAVPHTMAVMTALKCMANTALPAVAIVEAVPGVDKEPMFINGQGRKLVGTFSASDLRGCCAETLSAWKTITVMDWAKKAWTSDRFGPGAATGPEMAECRPPVTCKVNTSLGEAIAKSVENHIHRLWVVDDEGLLQGIVALSDILSALRKL
ncbi:hypothetical protein R1sor_027479 [Riccia sorocarpa]|uniref:CBS domain-containing protein n=1 Tax=Riccia sorocarpa TaxID=122646 RepID=A0ABD3GHZ6_9MARC